MCKNFPIMDPITIIPTLLRTQTLYLHRLKPMQHISDLLPTDFLVYKVYVIKACILCSIVFKEDTRRFLFLRDMTVFHTVWKSKQLSFTVSMLINIVSKINIHCLYSSIHARQATFNFSNKTCIMGSSNVISQHQIFQGLHQFMNKHHYMSVNSCGLVPSGQF